MINRKEKIRNYIRKKTEEILSSGKIDDNGIEAEDISYDLKIDRANISRELNLMWKDGYLIKIAGRPVFYLDSQVISSAYPEAYIPTFIPKENCLSDYINSANTYKSPYDNKLDLTNMIGADGSLAQAIEKAKAAICYPPYGLHTLITGNSGTEKSTLADSMVEYAIRNGIRNKKCPYYDIDCRRANANVTLFEEKLFGYQDEDNKENNRKGILEMCTNGFLLLQNIDYLPQSTAYLITSLLNKGYFTRMNSNTQIPVRFMMILISALPLDSDKLQPYTHYITTNIAIPDIDDRGLHEKLMMIMDCFAREARNIRKPLKVDKDVIAAYAIKIYKENITKLENEVRDACSHAYALDMNSSKDSIEISVNDLPIEVKSVSDDLVNRTAIVSVPGMLSVIRNDYLFYDSNGQSDEFDYFREYPKISANHLKEQFAREFSFTVSERQNFKEFVDQSISVIRNCSPKQLHELRRYIEPEIINTVDSTLYGNADYLIFKSHPEILYSFYLWLAQLLENENKPESSFSLEINEENYQKEFEIARTLADRFSNTGQLITDTEIPYIVQFLLSAKSSAEKNSASILVVARGESIASQMVAYVKENVKKPLNIDAVDFRSTDSLDSCLEQICRKVTLLNNGSGVLIVTDGEPFRSIADYVKEKTGISCAETYPLSMDYLLNLAEKSSLSIHSYRYSEISQMGHFEADEDSENSHIIDLIDNSISSSISFIDIYKAVDILKNCLGVTLSKLNLYYDEDIASVYIINGIQMLERVIRNEPLQNKKLYKFISANHELMQIVTQGLEMANQAYHIRIPQVEIANLVEKLLPFIK